MSDPQELVDALAADLERPVGIDDRRFRAIAYSSHDTGIDPVRMASILQREAPAEVIEYLESLGLRDAERYVRVPANPGFEMSARVCLPIRFEQTPLGFLWLIDEPTPLTDVQLEEAVRYARELAETLYRARLLAQRNRERERELVAQLLWGGDVERETAAAELVREGYIVTASSYAVIVLIARHPDQRTTPDPIRVRLVDAAEQVRRAVPPHHLLLAVHGEEIVAVLAFEPPDELGRRGAALADAAAHSLGGRREWQGLVGAGSARGSLVELGRSYSQARQAVELEAALGRGERFVEWGSLGAYRTIVAMLGAAEPDVDLLPASLLRLLAADDDETLIATLTVYLDAGGDARAAAAQLYIHRSSLYGRLHRIEEAAGVDLHSGEDRLELHLGLRLLQLRGGAA